MKTQIDPYLDWLQISADRRPPTHYDLLGLPAFEADAQRAQAAATRRIAHVRKYQVGMYSDTAIQLMGEISRALTCLSDPESKRAYDAQLRGMATLEQNPSAHETVADVTTPEASLSSSGEPTADYGLTPLSPELAGTAADAGLNRLAALVEQTEPARSEMPPTPAKSQTAGPSQAAAESESESNSRFLAIVAASVAAAIVVLVFAGWMLSDDQPAATAAADSREISNASDSTGANEESSANDPDSPPINTLPATVSTLPPQVNPPEATAAGNPAARPAAAGASPLQPNPIAPAGAPAPPAATPPAPAAAPPNSAPSPVMPSAASSALPRHGYEGFTIAQLVPYFIRLDPVLSLKAHAAAFNESQYDMVRRLDGQALTGFAFQVFKIPNSCPVRLRWGGYSSGQQIFLRYHDGRSFVEDLPGGRPGGTHELTINRPPEEPFVYFLVHASSGALFTDHFEVLAASPEPAVVNNPPPQGVTTPAPQMANNLPPGTPRPEFEDGLEEVKTLFNRTKVDKRADVNKWREVSNKLALLEQQVQRESERTLTDGLRGDLAKLARNRVDAAIKQKGRNARLYMRFLEEAIAMDPSGEAGQEAQQMLGGRVGPRRPF